MGVSRRRRLFLMIGLFLGVAAIGYVSAGGAAEEDGVESITLSAHHNMSTAHYYHQSAEKLAELLEERSGGTMRLNIFPAGQLGDDMEVLSMLQAGEVDVFFGAHIARLSSFAPEWHALNLPYIFENREHMIDWAVESDGAKKMFEELQRVGMKHYSFTEFSMRVPATNAGPLSTPDDFRGLAVRVMETPVGIDTYRALGASPTSLPMGEVYTSLETGVVDMAENGIETIYTQSWHEVAPHVTEVPILPSLGFTLLSLDTWESLSPEQQQILVEIEPELRQYTIDLIYGHYESAVANLEAEGAYIHQPEDPALFAPVFEGVWEKYLAEQEPWVQDVVRGVLGERYPD